MDSEDSEKKVEGTDKKTEEIKKQFVTPTIERLGSVTSLTAMASATDMTGPPPPP